ncbi:MAG: hypothetical protein ABI177_08640 [Edaphobacter sp.]
MRFILFVFVLLLSTGFLNAQDASCINMAVQDTRLPVYPPIARLANVQGTIRLKIHISPQGDADIKYLSGPNQGIFHSLVINAQEYIAGRKYQWIADEPRGGCDYTLDVEYRIVAPAVDPPNNFLRVTILDEGHTLVEARTFKPTCFDCRN